MDIYEYSARMASLYGLLQDDLSREVFWARIRCDLHPSTENVHRLGALNSAAYSFAQEDQALDMFRTRAKDAKVVLYGTGDIGRHVAGYLASKGIDFYAFCGRRASEYPNGLLGKTVISPDYLFEHPEDYWVQITSIDYYDEILEILQEHHFPSSHIIFDLNYILKKRERINRCQYFDFMEYFKEGTAFIDGGSYNGMTSALFAEYVEGKYSRIFAFEPDPENVGRCTRFIKTHPIRDFELIQAGLLDRSGEAALYTGGTPVSHIVEKGPDAQNADTIQVIAIDAVLKNEPVGMIKMDIEGSELSALHGAEQTILCNRPLMAICVYHRPYDTVAIMDYLNSLVPEYRFYLRHYTDGAAETVLYAFVHTH